MNKNKATTLFQNKYVVWILCFFFVIDIGYNAWIHPYSLLFLLPVGLALYVIILSIRQRAKQQQALFQAAARGANCLLTSPHFHTAITETIRILGEAARVDHVYIFECNPYPQEDDRTFTHLHTWIKDNRTKPGEDILQEILKPEYGLADWYSLLKSGSVVSGTFSKFTSRQKHLFARYHVCSILLVPIFIEQTLYGIIGFTDCEKERNWTANEETILHTIAASIGGAVRQHISNQTLEKRVQEEVANNRKKDLMLIQQSRLAAMGEMINNIAHQWRQPLNTLGLIIQDMKGMYEDGTLTDETMNEAIDDSMSQIRHMSKTINDFRLFFSPTKEPELFRPVEAIREAASLLRARFVHSQIQTRLYGDENLTVTGYPSEFRQAILTILMNAKQAYMTSKHTGQKTIDIYAREENGSAVITVEDQAGGIPEDVFPKIFDPYFTTKEQGTGIGLYISKMMIEGSMKGSLTAYNNGQGAVLRIEMPVTPEIFCEL